MGLEREKNISIKISSSTLSFAQTHQLPAEMMNDDLLRIYQSSCASFRRLFS